MFLRFSVAKEKRRYESKKFVSLNLSPINASDF